MSLDARLRFRHEFLPSLVDPSLRLNHSTPSLHPSYRASTLLRVDPPLCHASGLLPSWGFHLGISLGIVTTGSHVPRESLNRARATFTPVTITAVSRSRLDRIPGGGWFSRRSIPASIALAMPSLRRAPRLGGLSRASRVPFRASSITAEEHPLAATAQRRIPCLYKGWSYRFVAD